MREASELISEKVKEVFPDMAIKKNPENTSFFMRQSIPSFLRDWIIMRFADEEGNIDFEEVSAFIQRYIPRPDDWEGLKAEMVQQGKTIKFLTKVMVEIDVSTSEAFFSFPLLGFPKKRYEAIVDRGVLKDYKEELLGQSEVWGIIECRWGPSSVNKGKGAIYLTDFKPFRPYKVDLEYFKEARREFSLNEWIDLLLMAVDYNPDGFSSEKQKLTLLSRLLPFVEERVNLIELAPKGTGKSYMMSQISKYGWLISGGSITRAKLFYDLQKKKPGLVSRYDYIALDEIQTVNFPNEDEIAGALKGYLESGECRVGTEKVTGKSGFILMGNINYEVSLNDTKSVFRELPKIFSESALLDRFHGYIDGWNIPRMKENMKAEGWALNVEYFSEILHSLREDLIYSGLVESFLIVPRSADHRDVNAIKRICTAFLKLLFPHAQKKEDISEEEFERYCLGPAMQMRRFIKKQLSLLDPAEYRPEVPEISIRS